MPPPIQHQVLPVTAARTPQARRLPPAAVEIDWRRLGRRAFIAAAFALAAIQIYHQAQGSEYGLDFLGGTWHAGRAVLDGVSPYPAPVSGSALLHASSGFITPPPLALLGIPFSLLPFSAAVVAFNLLCAAALVGALRLLGVRDRRLYLLALCSFPFVSSLALGQPDGLFALAAAATWRYRDSWPGAVAAAALIAVKLLAWPLLIWFVVTRRPRQAGITLIASAVMLIGTWACIGFRGLAAYPRLLAADAKTYENRSHSLVAGLMHLGFSANTAVGLMFVLAALLGAAIVVLARGSDAGWFTAALTVGVFTSPIVWEHYLVLLFVCLAAMRRLRDPAIWLLTAALWIAPNENPTTLWQAWLVPVVAGAIALRAGYLSRRSIARTMTTETPCS